MSRVFVVQNQHHADHTGQLVPKFDLSPAQEYGKIVLLLSPSARPFSPRHVIGALSEALATFGDDDYLLLIGNPVLIGLAVAIASRRNCGRVRVLQWDGKARRYIPIFADISVIDQEIDKKDAI